MAGGKRRRARGEIEELPSGSFRVRVYSGIDPLTKKRHLLTEVVPAGPGAAKRAEKVRTRFLAEVDERRNPRTNATVNQLLERYFEVLTVEDTTLARYEGLVRLYIEPALGSVSLARLDGETLDAFYAELRRCRARCTRRTRVDHWTPDEHECDKRCTPHLCKPLGTSALRQVHTILNAALNRAVRWRWIGTNPLRQAETPPQPRPDPHPPTSAQAACIVAEAWRDPDWGMFVWLAVTTGARRGELCALRWTSLDFTAGVLDIRSAIGQVDTRTWEKSTKTHQHRRIVLDAQTLALLKVYLQHCAARAVECGDELREDGFIFASSPDGSTWLRPSSVSNRYVRMCRRLGWDMHIHQLRHYSATELIAAGVDVRTVAGRLGHGGGGTTTLRVYSAWVGEADQRASGALAARMPELAALMSMTPTADVVELPVGPDDGPSSPYQAIATDLRAAIRCGAFAPGDQLPTVTSLAKRYSVAVGTAHRAIALLSEAGEITVSRGRRAVIN